MADNKIVVELNLNVKEQSSNDHLDLQEGTGQTPEADMSAKEMSKNVGSSPAKRFVILNLGAISLQKSSKSPETSKFFDFT